MRQKLLHFGLMLHFAVKVVTFCVNVTFCVDCYILRRNNVCAQFQLRSKRSVSWSTFGAKTRVITNRSVDKPIHFITMNVPPSSTFGESLNYGATTESLLRFLAALL